MQNMKKMFGNRLRKKKNNMPNKNKTDNLENYIPERISSDDYEYRTSFLYGGQAYQNYSDLETEVFLSDGSPVNNAWNYIQETLDKFGLTKKELSKMSVLDIGTGRQAIRFARLGAKNVYHFDISERHIEQTKTFCKKHKIKNITSIRGDLTTDHLPEKKFDLVFAAGIYQHIQVPALGLANFAQSLKIGGRLYLGFYRSGDWRWFISAMIREGVKPEDFGPIKNKLSILYTLGDIKHFQVSRVIDDFFVPAQNCFHPRDIIADFTTSGLKVFHIDDDKREYNHEGDSYFTVLADRIYGTKTKHFTYDELLKKNFKTIKGIDQLIEIDYSDDLLIQENIWLWNRLVNMRNHGFIPNGEWQDVLINMYRTVRPFETKRDDYYYHATFDGRDKTLNRFFRNLIKLYDK